MCVFASRVVIVHGVGVCWGPTVRAVTWGGVFFTAWTWEWVFYVLCEVERWVFVILLNVVRVWFYFPAVFVPTISTWYVVGEDNLYLMHEASIVVWFRPTAL